MILIWQPRGSRRIIINISEKQNHLATSPPSTNQLRVVETKRSFIISTIKSTLVRTPEKWIVSINFFWLNESVCTLSNWKWCLCISLLRERGEEEKHSLWKKMRRIKVCCNTTFFRQNHSWRFWASSRFKNIFGIRICWGNDLSWIFY